VRHNYITEQGGFCLLSENVITDVLLAALSTGGDFAEIFMEDTYSTQIRMLDGAVDEAVSGRDFGVGIRIFQGWQSVYAYTNDVSREGLIKTAREAAAALRGVPAGKTVVLARLAVEKFNPVRLEPRLVKHGDRVAVMKGPTWPRLVFMNRSPK
jgi:TldD protein